MRQKLARHDDSAARRKVGSADHARRPAATDLGSVIGQAQSAYGNRSVGRLLQARLTRTACSCGETGAAECEECRSRTLSPSRQSRPAAELSTATLETDDDTETRAADDTQSITIEAAGLDTSTADGDGGASFCSVSGSFSSIPSGAVAATLAGNKLGAAFAMTGDFTARIPCNCSCGEYRQYVRGKFTRNGSTVTHALCGSNLDPTTFQEDCGIFGGTSYRYGYRSQAFATSKFTPDQAGGCRFEGQDAPGLTGSSGDTLGVDLEFRGELIDTCNGNAVLASSTWNVTGTATVP
jgi:hypothetical protein